MPAGGGPAQRFREDFWLEDAAGGSPAAALTPDGRPVSHLGSAAAHLLDTGLLGGCALAPGLLDKVQTEQLARLLVAPELDSGWGLRTLSAKAPGHNPFGHRGGAVRVHETAVAVAGLAAAGHEREAAALLLGALDAAAAFGHRLPEMYAGEQRDDSRRPAPHPTASRPAAVAAAGGVHMLMALAGIRPDAPERMVAVRPLAAAPLGELGLTGLRVAEEPFAVRIGASGTQWSRRRHPVFSSGPDAGGGRRGNGEQQADSEPRHPGNLLFIVRQTTMITAWPYDPSAFPPFAVTVDLVVLTVRSHALCALAVRRGEPPFQGRWALPGGFVRGRRGPLRRRRPASSAEETGLTRRRQRRPPRAARHLRRPRSATRGCGWSASPTSRSPPTCPRPGRAVTRAARAGPRSRSCWPRADRRDGSNGPLAFDHAPILADGVERARSKIEYSSLATAFCPPEFTVGELRRVYEAVWGVALDPRNFHRKVTGTAGLPGPHRRDDDPSGRPSRTAVPGGRRHPAQSADAAPRGVTHFR